MSQECGLTADFESRQPGGRDRWRYAAKGLVGGQLDHAHAVGLGGDEKERFGAVLRLNHRAAVLGRGLHGAFVHDGGVRLAGSVFREHDPLGVELHPRGEKQPMHGPFAGGVGNPCVGIKAVPGGGGNHYDFATPALRHQRTDGIDHVDHTQHIDLDHASPARFAGDAMRVAVSHETVWGVDAGGVNQHVGRAVAQHFRHGCRNALGVGHIAHHRDDVGRKLGGFGKSVQGATKDEGFGSGLSETFGCCLTHAAASAGDDHDLVFVVAIHRLSLASVSRSSSNAFSP